MRRVDKKYQLYICVLIPFFDDLCLLSTYFVFPLPKVCLFFQNNSEASVHFCFLTVYLFYLEVYTSLTCYVFNLLFSLTNLLITLL